MTGKLVAQKQIEPTRWEKGREATQHHAERRRAQEGL